MANDRPVAGEGSGAIGVGIIGLGNVGLGAYQILAENADFITRQTGCPVEVKAVADIRLDIARGLVDDSVRVTDDALSLISDPEIQIVCELIGGVKPAGDFIRAALTAGKSVVTSNKELIAKQGPELLALAESNGADFYFEGSVGGGIPIILPLRSGLAGNQIERILGIVNGTTNYILTEMSQKGHDLASVLSAAQKLGYAEADPTNDIEGYDARYKLTILASLGFHTRVNTADILCEGITKVAAVDVNLARQMGYAVKLLAIAKRVDGKIEARVHPALIPQSHPLASVSGVNNAIFVTGNAVGDVMFYGPGAGGPAAGSAVVGDVIEIARNICHGACGRMKAPEFVELSLQQPGDIVSRYYVRMRTADHPGVLAGIAKEFGDEQVSISSVLQQDASDGVAEIIFMTHEVREQNFVNALKAIESLEDVHEVCSFIRVEE